jgi:hypothetical protein
MYIHCSHYLKLFSGIYILLYRKRDRCKMMAEGKIIDVAVKKTSTGYNNNINHK